MGCPVDLQPPGHRSLGPFNTTTPAAEWRIWGTTKILWRLVSEAYGSGTGAKYIVARAIERNIPTNGSFQLFAQFNPRLPLSRYSASSDLM
jgi:hypothetical protein